MKHLPEGFKRYPPYMKIANTVSITPEDMEARHVARFSDLEDDVDVFPDIQEVNPRKHFHVISRDHHIGPARIPLPHHFHLSFMEVPPGGTAGLHAHETPEVFIVLSGRVQMIYGDDGEHVTELGQYDTISIPPRVMRNFKNVGNVSAFMIVIYDGPGDVLGEIFVNREAAKNLLQEQPGLAAKLLRPEDIDALK